MKIRTESFCSQEVQAVYDGTFCGKRVKGQGIFAQVLLKEGYQPDDIEDLEEVV